jgi:hypothetical protein
MESGFAFCACIGTILVPVLDKAIWAKWGEAPHALLDSAKGKGHTAGSIVLRSSRTKASS